MSVQIGKKSVKTKPFLWFLLFVQFILIVIFMIFSGSNNLSDDPSYEQQTNSVKFLAKLRSSEISTVEKRLGNGGRKYFSQTLNFSQEFSMVNDDDDNDSSKVNGSNKFYCYHNGTVTYQQPTESCECLPEWHGKECSLPEVLWRSFMTSKVPIKLSPPRKIPHKVFYIIQSTGTSLETLEVQMMELRDVVDYFILCDLKIFAGKNVIYKNFFIRSHLTNSSIISSLSHRGSSNKLASTTIDDEGSTGFLELYRKNRIILFEDRKCTPKLVYKKLKTVFVRDTLSSDDVLIYSKSDEILNAKPIKYFKWYDNWPQPVHFRLKYTVYGFYWQHPESTILGSVVSQLKVLEELYKSDPERMLQTKRPGLIVGDLNHFGGWFCQYCYQPIDIVQKLESDVKIVKFNYKQVVDSEYIQNLISNGLFVDGMLQLIKLHRYSEKYFAPNFVLANSWRFDNIMTNIFAKWDDNGDDEYL